MCMRVLEEYDGEYRSVLRQRFIMRVLEDYGECVREVQQECELGDLRDKIFKIA